MNQTNDNNDYIKKLGDEIQETMPSHLVQNLNAIPSTMGINTNRVLDKLSLVLNLILGAWVLSSILIFKESWVPLLNRLFAQLPISELSSTQWYFQSITLFLILGLWGVGIWWYDLTGGSPLGKTTRN